MSSNYQTNVMLFISVFVTQLGLWIACTSQELSSGSPDQSYEAPPSNRGDKKIDASDSVDSKLQNGEGDNPNSPSAEGATATTESNAGTVPTATTPPPKGNSQLSTPTAGSSNVVRFVIPKGTGAGAWNTADNPIRVKVGQTLEVVNDDSIRHQIHTNGRPFFHPFASIAPGSKATYTIQSEFSGELHDHLNYGKFFLTTK
jgi:hypothetical protein